MEILTLENKILNLDLISNSNIDVNYCVLEYKDEENTDFYFKNLLFLESFSNNKIILKIENTSIPLPHDWGIICGDVSHGELEVIPVSLISDRDFNAVTYNPLKSFRIDFKPITSVGFFPSIKWVIPRIEIGQFLALPYTNEKNEINCIYATQMHHKLPETIDISWLM